MNDIDKALSDTALLREYSKDRRAREEQNNGQTQVRRGENVMQAQNKGATGCGIHLGLAFSGSYRVCLFKRPQTVPWDIHGGQLQTFSCTPGCDCSTL